MIKLFQKFNIPYQTEGSKHCRPGWANMECPWCTGNPGLHLGWNIERKYFYCWRCGYHRVVPTLVKLTGLSSLLLQDQLKNYKWGHPALLPSKKEKGKKEFKLPSDVLPLQQQHRQYLEKRNFNPDEIIKTWGIMGTSPTSNIKEKDYTVPYPNRILIPIEWEGLTVSFQTRAINAHTEPKYKACPIDREIIPHKNILYGKPEMWTETGICVEGVFDVWRFGVNAFATFGIGYTKSQILCIAKNFKNVVIIFDDDIQAIKNAKKLQNELRALGVSTQIITIKGDPGEMEQEKADNLVKEIMNQYFLKKF